MFNSPQQQKFIKQYCRGKSHDLPRPTNFEKYSLAPPPLIHQLNVINVYAIEKGSIVAVGMIGCKADKISFMRGYNEMLKQIEPKTILCYGAPFKEMDGNIVKIDYWHKRNGGK